MTKLFQKIVFAGLAAQPFVFTQAGFIDVAELTLFSHADSFSTVLEDGQIGYNGSTFADEGLGVLFENNLNNDNFGTFSWTITNNGSSSILGLSTSVFFDAELSQYDNSFTNESGEFVGNTTATSWEIDEPGYTDGDLIWNLLDFAEGDNQNALVNSQDDVALSLGFFLDELNVGDFFKLTFEVSDQNIGGLRHFDVDSNDEYFFNGFLTYFANPDVARPPVTAVPEPNSFALLLMASCGLFFSRRRKR